MSEGLLLDTHLWLWMALNSPKITSSMRGLLSEAAEEDRLYVAAISLSEAANLVRANRIDVALSPSAWFNLFFEGNDLVLLPLTPEAAVATALLPDDFHGDPGDRLVAATA